jgi:hypothetical protein
MERFESVLGIPSSITSILSSVKEARGEGRGQRDGSLLRALDCVEKEVFAIRTAMIQFSTVTVDLGPWKHAHHCTNQILLKEMVVLFKMTRGNIAQLFVRDPEKIAIELEKVNERQSSRAYILAADPESLVLELPVALRDIFARNSERSSLTWQKYILLAIERLKELYEAGEAEQFYKMMDEYRIFADVLNQAADNKLLAGLGKLGDRLNELGSRLNTIG